MIPANFPEANSSFGPPADLAESQCHTIPAWCGYARGGSVDGAIMVVVAWKPTIEDLARLNAGEPLFLTCLGGLPPHFLTTSFAEATHPA